MSAGSNGGLNLTVLPGLVGGVGVNLGGTGGLATVDLLPGLGAGGLGTVDVLSPGGVLNVDLLPGTTITPTTPTNPTTPPDNGQNNGGGSGVGGKGWTPSGSINLDLATAYQNITRVDPDSAKGAGAQALISSVATQMNSQSLGSGFAVQKIIDAVDATTSVAVLTYQFFTGKTPSKAGLDFLVNAPDTLNSTDLTDAYYTTFNLENRYINFSVNLGLNGEAAASFKQGYGNLSFAQTVTKAYDTIIGISTAVAAGVDANAGINDIVSRKAAFEATILPRVGALDSDMALKAGVVGYILAEAAKANFGSYANALENFYFDLADGQAQFNVDLVGVYGSDTAWMA
ncbi:MAG: hypothetical protein ABW063_09555 [Caulobacter sp.]